MSLNSCFIYYLVMVDYLKGFRDKYKQGIVMSIAGLFVGLSVSLFKDGVKKLYQPLMYNHNNTVIQDSSISSNRSKIDINERSISDMYQLSIRHTNDKIREERDYMVDKMEQKIESELTPIRDDVRIIKEHILNISSLTTTNPQDIDSFSVINLAYKY